MHTQNLIMNLSNYLILFSMFHYLITSAGSQCPESFECGHLGTLEFPLYHNSNPGCGLFMVDGCDSGTPKIQFVAEGSHKYEILNNISTNKFLIRDPALQGQLETASRNATCVSLRNLSLHESPFTSFVVSPNLTMFLCNNNEGAADHFKNYNRTAICPALTVYYNSSDGAESGVAPSTEASGAVPPECSMIQLPTKANNHSGGLYDLLSGEFVVEWDVSKACYECHHGGGQCLTDNMNEFRCQNGRESSKKLLLIGGVTASFLSFTSIILFLLIRWRFIPFELGAFQDRNPKNGKGIELFLRNNGILAPRRFRYSEIKKITKSFRKNLGKGGYGSVYKGKLPGGRLVAVKILHESKEIGEEFMNEVASISRTSHVNVVTLLGFCSEGSKRALVYEFMPNGSLEKYIHNSAASSTLITIGELGWQRLFDISVGIARGLEYLHQGCSTRILHFDIKPHNILLDEDFNPKISDFGLARMCPNRSSIVSMMVARGTIGYIAPEVFSRSFGEVSHKSDVYSYGMMVLEIAGGRKCINPLDVDHTSEIYFPQYLYRELTEMEGDPLRGADLDGVMNEDDGEDHFIYYKRKLIIVGLWCIQTDPKDRPSMSKVVEMLEGKLESLQIPPKPYFSSPPRSAPDFSTSTSFSTPESIANLV